MARKKSTPVQPAREKLHVVLPAQSVKLDLACGQHPREGFSGVDLYAPNAEHKVNLWQYPLPWGDSSVDELHCSHFVEHLPAREITGKDGCATTFVGQDYFFAFFDECWRILRPGATMLVIVPCARSNRAFQDPTHRRFIVAETFGYLNAEWRRVNGLDHYRVRCNFLSNIGHTMPAELALLHPEAQARRFNHEWNAVHDWHATLKAEK